METTDLSRAMHAATDDLTPRPGFTEAVLRGGRRRTVRRRVGGAVVLAAVVGVVTITTLPAPSMTMPAAPAEDWQYVNGPTRGDLADDTAYLAAVRQAWTTGIGQSPNDWVADRPPVGEVRVVWAGTTPVGPAALVAQGVGPETTGDGTIDGPPVLGLLAGENPVLATERPPGFGAPVAFLFGPDDRMLLTLHRDKPLSWSHWVEDADGKGSRTWQDVPVVDGVGLLHLPVGTAPTADVRDPDRNLITLPASRYGEGVDRQSKVIAQRTLAWPVEPRIGVDGARGRPLQDFHEAYQVLKDASYADPGLKGSMAGFHAVADLPNGNTVTALEYVPAVGAGSRFYAVVTTPDGTILSVSYGGRIDPTRPLPARVRLPDGQGWIVAQYAASFQTRPNAGAAWQPGGANAALVPDSVQVEVTPQGQAPTIVTLE